MTETSTAEFRVHALPTETLADMRGRGRNAFGQRAEHVTAEGGEPLRCCLRDAEPGQALLLVGYQPPLPDSPYREVGAVLVHAEPCAGPGDPGSYPAQWRGRPQVLRAYDARGWIHDATRVHDGQHPEAVIAEMLAHPDVALIHSRNIAWGCYMFSVTRPE